MTPPPGFWGRATRLLSLAGVLALSFAQPPAKAQEARRVYRVAIDLEYEPYEFVDDQGNAQGFTPALLRAIGASAGVRFEFLPLTWPAAVEALGSGSVDLVSMIPTPERRARYQFSAPHSRITQGIFRNHESSDVVDLASLAGHRVGLQQDDVSALALAGRSDFEPRMFSSKLDGLVHLNVGSIDALICAQQAGVRLVSRHRLANISLVAGGLFPQDFAFATHQGNQPLIELLDMHLARLRASGRLQALSEEWLAGRLDPPGWMERNRLTLVALGGLLAGALLLVLIWNRSLQRRVRAATTDLREREARYGAMVNSISDAIISADSAGNIVGWNPGAERLYGWAESEILGRPLALLQPARDQDGLLADLPRAAASLTPSLRGETIELEGRRKDGSEFPLSLSLSEWQVGPAGFYTVIVHDNTGRKRAAREKAALESRLQQAQKMESVGGWRAASRTTSTTCSG